MKKILFLLCLFASFHLLAQNFEVETVKEIQAERELAEWIEAMLLPIVGETIVIANLTLEYPVSRLEVYGSILDKDKSLPGLPIAKSRSVMPTVIDDQETYPTIIVKKEITIYVKKDIDKSIENFIRQNIALWMHINPEKGDKLDIKSVLDLRTGVDSPEENKTIDHSLYFILGIVLLVILLLFSLMIRSGFNKLSSSMQSLKVTGFEKALHVKGSLAGESGGTMKSAASLIASQTKPLPIRVVNEKEEDNLDFHFLEELSMQNFFKLLEKEKPENIAFLLSNLNIDYVQEFLHTWKGDMKPIIKVMLSNLQKPKNEIENIRKKLNERYKKFLEDEKISFDGKETLINVINMLPTDDSKKLFAQVDSINAKTAKTIREKVFLFSDIYNLKEVQIENVVMNVEHNLLVSFLASVENDIKEKFLSSLTSRGATIIQEDLDFLGEISQKEQEQIRYEMLINIRKILNFIKE